MIAKYCDKCNKLFREDALMAHVKFEGMYPSETPEMDLCKKCHEKLDEFIYGG